MCLTIAELPLPPLPPVRLPAASYDARTRPLHVRHDCIAMHAALPDGHLRHHTFLKAVNASDYAIAQFAYLRKLLLVHGR